MNHRIRTALGLALAAGLLAACVPIPLPSLPSLPGISRPSGTKAPPIADRTININGSDIPTFVNAGAGNRQP